MSRPKQGVKMPMGMYEGMNIEDIEDKKYLGWLIHHTKLLMNTQKGREIRMYIRDHLTNIGYRHDFSMPE